jgi:hypothetical protein
MAHSKTGKIIFTEKNILVNNLVINFNEMGIKLADMHINVIDGWPLVQVDIETGIDGRKNIHNFNFPIPMDKIEEADRVVGLYKKLMPI